MLLPEAPASTLQIVVRTENDVKQKEKGCIISEEKTDDIENAVKRKKTPVLSPDQKSALLEKQREARVLRSEELGIGKIQMAELLDEYKRSIQDRPIMNPTEITRL